MKKNKVLLAFSGGLDTSAIVPWLIENHDAEVIAYCSDLGNAPDEKYLEGWAKELGAKSFIFEDLRDRFASEFAFAAVRAGAVYQDDYLLGTALGRPLIAERMAHFARELGANAIAHGATGKGNDQLRFEKSWAYLVPEVQVIAPWKVWDFKGRQDLVNYLVSRGIPMQAADKLFSVDVNLFHRSCEGGILENPEMEYDPARIQEWIAAPGKHAPDPVRITVGFEQGLPRTINGKKLSPAALLTELNQIAGRAGVGVVDLLEERSNGIKSRGVYETPGGTLLHLACKSLKHLCWDRSLLGMARIMGQHYGELVYDGLWHTDSRKAAEAYFVSAAETLSGEVKLRLEGGQVRVASRVSPYALYDESMVTFESDALGLLKNAEGYCKTVSFAHWRAGRRDGRTGRRADNS
jgi:argininosuccinate synthase